MPEANDVIIGVTKHKEENNDIVPVVRCKDCKYSWSSLDGLRCKKFGTYSTDPIVEQNDFCSRGKHV